MDIPKDIYSAFVREAKSWVLTRYIGGKRKLEAWNEHYAHLTSIRSNSLPGDTRKNLRKLAKLSKAGVLVERPRSYRGQMRSFTLPSDQLNDLGREAVSQWERFGYVIGVMMDEIPGTEAENAGGT